MQSTPLVSVDMMSAGPPASTSTPKTVQEGLFAAHLTAASQGPATTVPQAKAESGQDSHPAPTGQAPDVGTTSTTQPTAALDATDPTIGNTTGKAATPGYDLAARLQAVLNAKETGKDTVGETPAPGFAVSALLKEVLDTKEKKIGSGGETPASDATLKGSAGAALAGMIPLYWTGAESQSTPNQNIAKTQNSQTTMSQMLQAITAAAGGTMGTAQTKNPISPAAAEATAPVNNGPVVQNNTAAQTFTIDRQPPQLATISPPPASPDIAASILTSTQGSIGKTDIAQTGGTILPPQVTVSFVPDPAPAAVAASIAATAATLSAAVQTQPAALQAAAQPNPAQQGGDQIVQNTYGQIITIYQTSESEEPATATAADSKPLPAGTNSLSLDTNNNSIHSHLPNIAPKVLDKEGNRQQQDTAQGNQQKDANTAKALTNVQSQPEQPAPSQISPLTLGTENQSLIFTHQQANTPLTSSAPLVDSSSLRLPSGLVVPGETVVDQMISHLSVSNRLESGTVNLRLSPQELGELRMEIKISQDTIKAHIIAQTPQAQEMISQHLPRLREALEQQGLQLQKIEVTIAAHDNAGRDQFQGNTGQQQMNQSTHHSRGNQPIFALDTSEEPLEDAQIMNNISILA